MCKRVGFGARCFHIGDQHSTSLVDMTAEVDSRAEKELAWRVLSDALLMMVGIVVLALGMVGCMFLRG